MEKILNAFLYCAYLMEVKLHYLSNKVNPAWLLLYIPCIKKKFERKNQDPIKEVNKIITNKETGFSIDIAFGIAGGVIFIILISSIILVNRILNFHENVSVFYFIICWGISMVIIYLYMTKNDIYLSYFEKYEKWSKREKKKYVILSFLVIIAAIAYFFMSLMCC